MKYLRHPNFILGLVSILLFFVGIGLYANGYGSNSYVLIIAVALGAIHWIWSIIDVSSKYDLGERSRRFWLILVIAIPAFGSMFYYMMPRKNMRM